MLMIILYTYIYKINTNIYRDTTDIPYCQSGISWPAVKSTFLSYHIGQIWSNHIKITVPSTLLSQFNQHFYSTVQWTIPITDLIPTISNHLIIPKCTKSFLNKRCSHLSKFKKKLQVVLFFFLEKKK